MQTPTLTSSPLSSNDSLLLALFVAFLVHIGILLGIHFKAPEGKKSDRSIEITLSHAPLKKAPKEARVLAADHQLGAGDETQKPEPIKQHLPSPAPTAPTQPQKTAEKQTHHDEKKPQPQKVLTQTMAHVKAPSSPEVVEETVEQPKEQHPHLTPEALQQQIAQLGEQIRTSRQSSDSSKIKFVNSVSTHKYLAAQYVKDWEDKVERTGNLNYPEAARKSGASQMLTMDVGINADGSIYSIRIVKSSGNPALDEAAKRIVKMSSPFAELPVELLQELNVLVITRVWKFSDETGMTAR